jgi:serine/threonine protein kinase
MNTDILHPDRLGAGDSIGPWRIVDVLGAGGLGRVFKVESEGRNYALKMAVRLPGEKLAGEEDVDGWCTREATAMLQRTPHPHIPRVFSVGRWPDPESGFVYMVMEHVDGWQFHDWRYDTHPSSAQLVDVLLPLVRTVADLHLAGIQHRDLNASNVLIRRADGQPVLLDFGSVSLPGARPLTQGIPPINLSVVPPEAFEHERRHGMDVPFKGGAAADLYALGVLMYSALTDGYPFNPALPPERLIAAITLRTPRAPHRVNPKVPLSLSRITLRLLAKRPEDRFESAEALYQALWDANKERTSREWKVPLDLPGSGPAPISDEEWQERKHEEEEAARRAAEVRDEDGREAPPDTSTEVPPTGAPSMPGGAVHGGPWEHLRRPLLIAAMACVLGAVLLCLASWWSSHRTSALPQPVSHAPVPPLGQEVASLQEQPEARADAGPPEAAVSTPAPIAARAMPSEESVPVKTQTNVPSKQPVNPSRTARRLVAAAVTCTALTGCPSPSPQVRPAPPGEACPEGAIETMNQWNIRAGYEHLATFTPYENVGIISVNEGRATLIVTGGNFEGMPNGTMLTGQLFAGERVYGRFTQAQTPKGGTFPVCFELEDLTDRQRGLMREPDEGPNTLKVLSSVTVKAVHRFQ